MINDYLMDEYYEKNRDMWSSFINTHQKLSRMLDKMQENDIFDVGALDKYDVIDEILFDSVDTIDDMIPGVRVAQFEPKDIEDRNGAELMIFLDYLCQFFEGYFEQIKYRSVYATADTLDSVYYYNYFLYAKRYWPNQVEKFRSHVENQRLRGKVDINKLESLREELIRDFEYNTPPGRIRRDYSEDKPKLAIQMKEQKLNEGQWEYFFKTIFELEEFDRWIEELRIDDGAKAKAAVLTENEEFMQILQKAINEGFCQQEGWRYKWGVKVEAAYFASLANDRFKLSKRKINGKKPAVSWIPFEALFGLKELRTAFNDYKQCKTVLVREEEIDKLFE